MKTTIAVKNIAEKIILAITPPNKMPESHYASGYFLLAGYPHGITTLGIN